MRKHLGARLDAYLDGSLNAEGRAEVESHLRACPDCARELEAFKALAARMESARPAETSSGFRRYWDRLLGRHGEVKTMTAVQRLKRIVQSNVHAAIDGMEEPSKMIRQLLREMEDALAGAREELAEALALEKRLEQRWRGASEGASAWEEKAALALRNGREDLAREALGEKLTRTALAEDLRGEWERQKGRVAELRAGWDRLGRQLEELKRRKAVWLARAQRSLVSRGSREAYRSAYDELARMVEAAEENSAREAAREELERPEGFESALSKMSEEEALEKELEALKRRLQA